jgi:hypothetical protein
MAIFGPYIGVGIQTGSKQDIYLNFFGWNKVGEAEFEVVEDYRLFFKGEVKVSGNVRGFSADLTLTDRNPTSTKGPSRIEMEGMPAINGSYSVTGNKLVISASSPYNQTVTIDRGGPNWPETYTYLLLTGKQHYEVQLRPSVSTKSA